MTLNYTRRYDGIRFTCSASRDQTGGQRCQEFGGRALQLKVEQLVLEALEPAGVDAMLTKILYTMPDCTLKTTESVRKKKLEHWDKNKESNRAWLSLNMMTEAKAGFQAFHRGSREVGREVDFIDLRRRLAAGEMWGDDLIESVSPQYKSDS